VGVVASRVTALRVVVAGVAARTIVATRVATMTRVVAVALE